MTTAEIEGEANRDQLATGEIDLPFLLRNKVIYDFLADVGYVAWVRKYDTATLAVGARYFDISDNDFRHMKTLSLTTPTSATGLRYIGEDESKILQAIANVTSGRPGGYWIGSDGNDFKRVFVDAPSDIAYTASYSYDYLIPFPSPTGTYPNYVYPSLDLNPYIPKDCQWPLVSGLRREIMRRRHGAGDQRFQMESDEYDRGIMRITENKEKSSGTKQAYIR